MKALSQVAKDAMQLRPKERRTLARILLELSEEDNDFSPDVESAWGEEIACRMEAVRAGAARARSYKESLLILTGRFPS